MRRQIIDNLLGRPDTPKRFCHVLAPLAHGRYRVQDAGGRIFDVDSDAAWSPGDGVTVEAGRIVGRAARFVKPKEYEVP